MPKKSRYYDISSDYLGGKFVNYDTVQPGWHGVTHRDGWPDGYLQMPMGPGSWLSLRRRFLIDRKQGRRPRDLEITDGVFLVSPAMKAVLEAVDPDSCEFVRCETVLPSGEPGRETWLCAITRAFVGAIDPQASGDLLIRSGPNGLPGYSIGWDTKLCFIREIVGNARLFHIAEMAFYVFCDQSVKDACKAAGLRGIRFRPRSK